MALFSILVDIAAKTASFEQGIKRVEDQLSDFGEKVKGALEFAGIGLGIKELISQFDEFAEHAEAMSHAAEKTGLAVDELSKLQYAASQTGVSTDSLSSAIERFAKSATESTTKAGEQRAAFAAIGVSVTDANGAIKPMQELLGQVADKFESYQDSAEKTALAQILFGKSGADLIPLLNLGAKGLEDMGQRATDLGVVLDEKTVKSAEQFNSKLTDLKAVGTAFWKVVDSQLLPVMTEVVDSFINAGTGANKFNAEIQPLVTGVKLLSSAAAYALTNLENIGSTFGALAAIAVQVAHGNFTEAVSIWKEGNADIEKNNADLGNFLDKLWGDNSDLIEDFGDKWADNVKKTKAPIVSLVDSIGTLLDALNSIDEKVRGTVASNTDTITKAGESALTASLNRMHDTSVHFWDQLDQIGQTGAKSVQSSFADFLFDPASKGFGGLVTGFANALKRMLADAAATDIFNALFGKDKEGNSGLGGIFGGLLGSLFSGGSGAGSAGATSGAGDLTGDFGGFAANGGPLDTGKWYVAGEHGPEPIWGGGAGAFATGYGGGGGAVINNNIDARGASFDLIKALPGILRQNNAQLEAKIVTGLQRNKY